MTLKTDLRHFETRDDWPLLPFAHVSLIPRVPGDRVSAGDQEDRVGRGREDEAQVSPGRGQGPLPL